MGSEVGKALAASTKTPHNNRMHQTGRSGLPHFRRQVMRSVIDSNGPGLRNMSDDTLELLIRSYIRDVTASEVVFTWQGGEPTLRGLDFFRKAVALQQKYAKPGQTYEVIFVRPGVKK